MQTPTFTIALAGNPNSGKTTIFNAVTGSRQHVGNYPGVTVEKKEGFVERDGVRLHVVDLPGTYSLTAFSEEEVVARNFVLDEQPDVIIDIVDSSNLERNLYLAVQFMELGVPLVLAFNKSDIAAGRGSSIDIDKLSALLGVPIVPTVGHKGKGLDELLDRAAAVARQPDAASPRQDVYYGHEVEPHVRQLAKLLEETLDIRRHVRWFALKLLENDPETIRRLRSAHGERLDDILAQARRLRGHIEKICGDQAEIILADRRYGFISGACTETVRLTVEARHARSDRIDAVLTNRFLGLPIFALAMYLVFQVTFALGNPIVAFLDDGKVRLAGAVRNLGSADSLLTSLLADGVIEGVGAVLVFVPLIALLYLTIALLEDSGYMARAAFILDGLMHRIGLHGKSFIPMLIGFGCTVPAVMSTRIIESRRDRLTTMLVLPLMSCGARLPVYVLLIGTFFPSKPVLKLFGLAEVSNQGLLLFGMYLIGIVLAIASVRILRWTIFRGHVTPFVMELPPYRLPAVKGLLVHTWERTWEYLKKAGTIILAIVIVLWALKTFPAMNKSDRVEVAAQAQARGEDQQVALQGAELRHSTIGRIGRAIEPVLRPCGFDWKIDTALLGSFAAKEVFVGQMGVIYSSDDENSKQSDSLRAKLAKAYTPLQGICMMLFVLISSPCLATVAVTARESGSWKWAALQWGYLTALAWIVTTMVFQIGRLVT